MVTLGELYEAEELARIDAGERPARPVVRGRDHPVAAAVLVGALGLGLAEVFDPEPEEPVIEEVDPTGAWRHGEGVRITGMELGPRHTVAWVRR